MSYGAALSNWNCMSYRAFSPFVQQACKQRSCTLVEDALLTENVIFFLDDVLVRSRSKAAMGVMPNTTPLSEMYVHLCKTGNSQKLWILAIKFQRTDDSLKLLLLARLKWKTFDEMDDHDSSYDISVLKMSSW